MISVDPPMNYASIRVLGVLGIGDERPITEYYASREGDVPKLGVFEYRNATLVCFKTKPLAVAF
jgi:hypothetical protein